MGLKNKTKIFGERGGILEKNLYIFGDNFLMYLIMKYAYVDEYGAYGF